MQYDSSTQWVSQEHGSKKVNDIDASQVADNDRVICLGSWSKDGVLLLWNAETGQIATRFAKHPQERRSLADLARRPEGLRPHERGLS